MLLPNIPIPPSLSFHDIITAIEVAQCLGDDKALELLLIAFDLN